MVTPAQAWRQTSQKVLLTNTSNVFSKQKSTHVENMIQCRATDSDGTDQNELGRDRMCSGVRMQLHQSHIWLLSYSKTLHACNIFLLLH